MVKNRIKREERERRVALAKQSGPRRIPILRCSNSFKCSIEPNTRSGMADWQTGSFIPQTTMAHSVPIPWLSYSRPVPKPLPHGVQGVKKRFETARGSGR